MAPTADGVDQLGGMDEFRAWLGAVLSSRESHNLINNLLRDGGDRAAS